MPAIPPRPADRREPSRSAVPRASRSVPTALVALLLLAGCGTPPELRRPTAPVVTATPTATAAPSATPAAPDLTAAPDRIPSAAPSAAPCGSGLSGSRVVALLRGSRVLPRDARVTVGKGPLCAEDWQYTVLTVAGHEELQVVTQGKPTALELVTAGTDVCSAEVRVAGPAGIRALACDGIPGA